MALGRPIVQGIKGVEISDDTITARREIDGGFEVYELPRPAVLGIKEGLNLPRYPTMKGRLASKKVELNSITASAAEGGQVRVKLHRPEETVSETVILGTGAEAARPWSTSSMNSESSDVARHSRTRKRTARRSRP